MDEKTKKRLEKIKNSPWGFFINRRPIAWLALIGIIISGTISLMAMPREIQPEVKIPFVAVSTGLPGANPTDTETLLSIPLEKKIADVSDIKSLSSTSGFGFSSIFIEFDAKADMDKVIQDVKDAVDMAKTDLPEDATEPVVIKAEANTFSIITFSLIGDRPLSELTNIAEDIKDELEKVDEISTVQILGGQKKFIEITLNQEKVEGYGLNIQTVSDLIKFSNNNLPVGIITSGKINYSVRIDNRYQSLEDIRNIPLFTVPDGKNTPILLKDIADVEETYPVQTVISKLSENGEPSLPTVSLQVFNKDDTNIVAVADNAREKIKELQENEIIPKDIDIAVTNDNSIYIREELGNLTQSGIQTTILIIIILFLALGLAKGIIAGLSIPVIFLIAFTVMDSQNMTINTLSLFSLVIALGLMVDTSIVIMEGIHENLIRGFNIKDSALLSVDTYKWPLAAGTLTTVFAFFPMLLVSGILGEFLKTLPITISAALVGSLFIALTLSPSISTKFVKKRKEGERGSVLEPFFNKVGEKFHNTIEYLIQRKIARIIVILSAVFAFIGSISLPLTGALKVEMFPVTDVTYFILDIETPKGTVIEETKKITEKVEQYLYTIPEVDNFVTRIGTSQALGLSSDDEFFVSGGTTESNLANITVNLIDKEDRERKSYEISKQISDHFKYFTEANIKVDQISEGPPTESPITARVTGTDFDNLQEISNKVKNIIENTEGTDNVELSLTPGLNEFKFTLDRDKLAFHGLSSMQVSAFIRNTIQGINPMDLTLEGEDFEIIVKYDLPEEENKTNISIHDIENLEIETPKGYSVTLSQIGSYEFTQSLSSISREGQKRIIKVTSDLEKDVNAVETIDKIKEEVAQLDMPNGYDIKFGGDLEQIEESFRDLFKSMFVALILIAFTLVLMFNSFRQPLIILFTLPLALIGVFPGLMIIGLQLSFPAFLGVVALTGVVVNDAIVLIDRININRKNGMEFAKSIAEAANARLQPILMTSITTIVGILPLSLTNEFWAGLGFSLIFGLACSTVLTLLVIPIMYYGLEFRKEKKRLLKEKTL